MADNTSVDLGTRRNATDQQVERFRLDTHLLGLLWDEPFFSSIMRSISKVKENSIPTAGVAAVNDDLKLYWNPKFFASLTNKEVKGVLKHECWHLILNHVGQRRRDPHLMWNYATDWAINSMIPEDELPEEGLRPGREFTPLTDEQLGRMTPEQVSNYQKISDFQANLPLEKSSEWYFERLMNNKDVKEAVENGNKVGGKSLGQALEDGDVKFDENGDLVDANGNPVDIVPGAIDDHDGWDNLNDEQRQMVKGKIKKTLEKATRSADVKGSGWGSISAEHRALIRKLISNEIPWQSVLKQFCGMTRRANRHSNVRRLHRKYPGIHPGVQKGYTSSIAVYIDQSGSVSDSELELLFGELASLARNTSFTVYHFDTEVDETSETEWKKGRIPTTLRTRSGGTCFKAPSEHANKNKHRFDGYLILTDGGAGDPGHSKLKRGWVLTPGQDLYFKDTSPRDFVIRMKKKSVA